MNHLRLGRWQNDGWRSTILSASLLITVVVLFPRIINAQVVSPSAITLDVESKICAGKCVTNLLSITLPAGGSVVVTNGSMPPTGVSVAYNPATVSNVAPGGTANFSAVICGSGPVANGTFTVRFAAASGGATLGTIPVTIAVNPAYVVTESGAVVVTSGVVEVRYSSLGNVALPGASVAVAMEGMTYVAPQSRLHPTMAGDTNHPIATVSTTIGNVRTFTLARGAKVQVKGVCPP